MRNHRLKSSDFRLKAQCAGAHWRNWKKKKVIGDGNLNLIRINEKNCNGFNCCGKSYILSA